MVFQNIRGMPPAPFGNALVSIFFRSVRMSCISWILEMNIKPEGSLMYFSLFYYIFKEDLYNPFYLLPLVFKI